MDAVIVPLPSSATLASLVYDKLRRDIVSGVLAPGEKLRIDGLRARYAIGGTPVREALNRLAAERLVSQLDQRGFYVASVSLDDLLELTRTRCWVNEIALREAITRGDAAWEEGIVLAFYRLSKLHQLHPDISQTQSAEWEQRHRDFHAALIAACGSRWIRDFAERLFDCADRYRHLAGDMSDHDPRDIEAEHQAILDATVSRDAATAIRLLNHHVTRTAETICRTAEIWSSGGAARLRPGGGEPSAAGDKGGRSSDS